MDRITLKIDGMTCEHCVRSVREALTRVDGVKVENVDIGSATVQYDLAEASEDLIAQAIESEGYTVSGSYR